MENRTIDYIRTLADKKKELLRLPHEKLIDRILEDKYPAALVHSFSEEDFYFLIHDIGAEDSLELLALASDRQWEYILDMEIWNKDRIQIPSVTRWLQFLLQAAPNRLIQWLIRDHIGFFEYYLFHNIRVIIREHDQDPSELGDNLFTLDDVIYIRFDQRIPSFKTDDDDEEREKFLTELLHRLADYDFKTYRNILFEAESAIPSEDEEESYRIRNIRLAEKGFVPFDEAVGVYQPVKPEGIRNAGIKYFRKTPDPDTYLPIPVYSDRMPDSDNLFARALKQIGNEDILGQLQSEFAGLSNHIISADQKPVRDRKSLKTIVDKAAGYISTGLELLTRNSSKSALQEAAGLIQTYPLSNIFRVGWGAASELKWEAQKWREDSWFKKYNLPITFWGEEWTGVLGGLFIPKPLFFDNYRTGALYREFHSLADIRETGQRLRQIMTFDEMLSKMNLTPGRLSKQFLTYKSLLLTLWARHYLGLSDEPERIRISRFVPFFHDLLPDSEKPRKTAIAMKSSFLNWISEKSGTDAHDISQKTGSYLENLFMEIESEYGYVSVQHPDPKHVHLFLLAPD